jgi:hypothetical protein
MMRLLLIALFFEVGIVLSVVPWSVYWDRNYFAESVPLLHLLVTNNFVRGAVTGLGLLNLATALVELLSLFTARRDRDAIVSIGPSSVLEDK